MITVESLPMPRICMYRFCSDTKLDSNPEAPVNMVVKHCYDFKIQDITLYKNLITYYTN